ncbi:MAG TPA: hypothetical protein EYP14_12770 [Planctomycetaceae bacterium]|nr:hypothetical protein [Planctomycetaceae bacterium]
MFRCQICRAVVPSGVRSQKLIVKTREKTYAAREPAPKAGRYSRRRNRHKSKQVYDRGGHGREIVRELTVCPMCAEKYE